MDEYESLSHTTWDCKYHGVFIPKCRRKTLYQELRRHLGEVFRKLALQKDSKVEEGHLMPDHVHMLLSIPLDLARISRRGRCCDVKKSNSFARDRSNHFQPLLSIMQSCPASCPRAPKAHWQVASRFLAAGVAF